jgi:predicted GIY-YIG superfamily endonuclease
MWFIYVLKCADNTFYVGQTSNLSNRLLGHISGNGTVFTRSHKPESLYYVETAPTRDKAIKRETALMRQFKDDSPSLILNDKYHGLF